jgi:hypothetical protein
MKELAWAIFFIALIENPECESSPDFQFCDDFVCMYCFAFQFCQNHCERIALQKDDAVTNRLVQNEHFSFEDNVPIQSFQGQFAVMFRTLPNGSRREPRFDALDERHRFASRQVAAPTSC